MISMAFSDDRTPRGPSLEFTFKSLGPIDEGVLSLNQLTVVTGKNNTGKTYLTYALYGFLSRWRDYVVPPRIQIPRLLNEGEVEVSWDKLVADRTEALNQGASNYIEELSNVLAADERRFASTSLTVTLSHVDAPPMEIEATLVFGGRQLATITKAPDSSIATITLVDPKRRPFTQTMERQIRGVLQGLLFGNMIPDTYIASTERTGAVAFKSELNLSKSRLLEVAIEQRANVKLDPAQLLQKLAQSGYPRPVRDNVDFINQLDNVVRQTSKLSEDRFDIIDMFRDLIGGDYKLDRNGELTFVPSNFRPRTKPLRMGESSSAVRSLVFLRFYLLNLAKPGDLLMVDEPELNLHPSNQRKLARLISALCNYGIKVFVTTHSDYLLRELNTLVQIHGLGEVGKAVSSKYGYQPEEGLDANIVSIHVLECVKRKRGAKQSIAIRLAHIDPRRGVDSTTFDETINEMNNIQSELFMAQRAVEPT
ncbi:MAG TPA: ATP-binding protein [Fimbriimonadaceae bacterium]|nr:ATP-binding protein [Fimbriimonadaceae bacterium]